MSNDKKNSIPRLHGFVQHLLRERLGEDVAVPGDISKRMADRQNQLIALIGCLEALHLVAPGLALSQLGVLTEVLISAGLEDYIFLASYTEGLNRDMVGDKPVYVLTMPGGRVERFGQAVERIHALVAGRAVSALTVFQFEEDAERLGVILETRVDEVRVRLRKERSKPAGKDSKGKKKPSKTHAPTTKPKREEQVLGTLGQESNYSDAEWFQKLPPGDEIAEA